MTTRVRRSPPNLRGPKTQWYNGSWVDAARHHHGEVMKDKFARYAHRLESLSITELSRGAEKLLSVERRHTAALIVHLAEISEKEGTS